LQVIYLLAKALLTHQVYIQVEKRAEQRSCKQAKAISSPSIWPKVTKTSLKKQAGFKSVDHKKIYRRIEKWRNRRIEEDFPYVYLDGIVLKRTWGGEVRNASVLVAIGVSLAGYRKILGVCEGAKEDKAGWSGFLRHLKERGLGGIQLIISDACLGLVESIAEFYPKAKWQRCTVHFYRNVFSVVPKAKMKTVTIMLKAFMPQRIVTQHLKKPLL